MDQTIIARITTTISRDIPPNFKIWDRVVWEAARRKDKFWVGWLDDNSILAVSALVLGGLIVAVKLPGLRPAKTAIPFLLVTLLSPSIVTLTPAAGLPLAFVILILKVISGVRVNV